MGHKLSGSTLWLAQRDAAWEKIRDLQVENSRLGKEVEEFRELVDSRSEAHDRDARSMMQAWDENAQLRGRAERAERAERNLRKLIDHCLFTESYDEPEVRETEDPYVVVDYWMWVAGPSEGRALKREIAEAELRVAAGMDATPAGEGVD